MIVLVTTNHEMAHFSQARKKKRQPRCRQPMTKSFRNETKMFPDAKTKQGVCLEQTCPEIKIAAKGSPLRWKEMIQEGERTQ